MAFLILRFTRGGTRVGSATRVGRAGRRQCTGPLRRQFWESRRLGRLPVLGNCRGASARNYSR